MKYIDDYYPSYYEMIYSYARTEADRRYQMLNDQEKELTDIQGLMLQILEEMEQREEIRDEK